MVKGTYVDKNGQRKGAWTQEEDDKLRAYVERYGHWNWRLLPKFAGLDRCGKSCRLRWMNYLKPGIRRGDYTQEERDLITKLHREFGNKWSAMAEKLPGRTDNGIKNYWHAHLKNRKNTASLSGEEAEISELRDGSSSSNIVVTSQVPKLCNRKRNETRVSSSDAFVLESSESNSTVVPTAVEFDSNISSITSMATQDTQNFSDLLVSGFHDSFWTQPFIVATDSFHGYDFRVCDEGESFSPLFYKWLNDANDML